MAIALAFQARMIVGSSPIARSKMEIIDIEEFDTKWKWAKRFHLLMKKDVLEAWHDRSTHEIVFCNAVKEVICRTDAFDFQDEMYSVETIKRPVTQIQRTNDADADIKRAFDLRNEGYIVKLINSDGKVSITIS